MRTEKNGEDHMKDRVEKGWLLELDTLHEFFTSDAVTAMQLL